MIPKLQEARLRRLGARPLAVPVRGGTVHVWQVDGGGALPPVALLHGLGASSVAYLQLVRALLPHVQALILPDLPGHGRTPWPVPVTCTILRDAALDAITAVAPAPPVIFGNSLGGYGALWVAGKVPDQVRGVLVTSPAGGALPDDERPQVQGRFVLDSHREAVDLVERSFHGYRGVSRHGVALIARRNLNRPAVRHIVEALTPEDDLQPDDIRHLPMPVQVYWGTAERALSRSQLAWFRAHLPAHAEFHEPEGWGHAAFRERPAEVSAALLRFLRSV